MKQESKHSKDLKHSAHVSVHFCPTIILYDHTHKHTHTHTHTPETQTHVAKGFTLKVV